MRKHPPVKRRMRWRCAQLLNYVIRFRDLALCQRMFARIGADTWAVRRLFGFRMYLHLARSQAQQLLYLMGERFIEERSLVERLVKPNMTIVDVGANIGYYLLLFEKLVGPAGRVICIEPSKENLPELKLNIAENAFDNVTLHEVAVGASEAVMGVRSGINGGMVDAAAGSQSVRVMPLDELVEVPVDLIKIDVDGYEEEVLQGALKVMERDRPVLFLEVHPHLLSQYGATCRSIHDLLARYYDCIKAYDIPRPETVSVFEKMTHRYGAGNVRAIENHRYLAEQADEGRHPFTYWLICR